MKDYLKRRIENHFKILKLIEDDTWNIFNDLCINSLKALKKGKKIISMGNGGSAADTIHFTGELVAQFKKKRKSLPAISLNSNMSIITSIGNDISYDKVFSRQLEGLHNRGDITICLTTSGNSKNIIEAVKLLNNTKSNYYVLTGKSGGKIKNYSKKMINVPSHQVDLIQEVHYMILHSLCDFIDENI